MTSGIADWWTDIAPFPTFEGVNPVMAQQSSRLIFKNAQRAAKGKKLDELFAYLANIDDLISKKSTATTVEEFH